MNPRREPLLWIQLLAIGVIPLHLILLRVVLAGADPGPIPNLERLLTWALGVMAPTFALWKRPADWGSLLLLRRPLRDRSETQMHLSGLQQHLIPRSSLLFGCFGLLITFWWIDQSALLANEFSPLKGSSRLVTLLTSVPLLGLILWHWHQLCQSLWLLTRSEDAVKKAPTINEEQLKQKRICLGLSLLKIPELTTTTTSSIPSPTVDPKQTTEKKQGSKLNASISEKEAPPNQSSKAYQINEPKPKRIESDQSNLQKNADLLGPPSIPSPTVDPKQTTEKKQGSKLNASVSEKEAPPSQSSKTHDTQT